MDSNKPDKTSADDAKIKSDLFNLLEKLQIELRKKDQELQVKDEELAKEKQKNQKFSADLRLEKARANKANEFKDGLVNAQQIIRVLQLSLWKSFPSPGLSYYIKAQSEPLNGQFLYIDRSGCGYGYSGNSYGYAYLRSSADDQSRSEFKFTKNSDGSFSIDSMGKYLQIDTHTSIVGYDAGTGKNQNAEKFVLFFHQQSQQAGILVQISSLGGSFLCVNNENYVAATSHTPPANKFLIIPVGVE